MKVALIRKEYNHLRGGAERYAVNLSRGLAAAGHDVHVFAGDWETQDRPGITLHRVPFVRRPSPLKNLSFQRNSRRLVAGEHFDIVQGLSQVFPTDVYRMAEPLHIHWLRLTARNKLKRCLKYISPRHMAILALERRIFTPGKYRRIIAISQLCRQQLMHYYGVPEDKIRLIYNGVDFTQFNTDNHGSLRISARTRFSIPESDTVLLFAGNDFKRKGLQFALQYGLALQAKDRSVRLLVAGKGNPAPFLRLARQRGFENNLLFLGSLPDMREAYHCADLLVHPALYEPFGNVCLEAMACGLPVVTTRLTGAADIMDDGVNGIITGAPWDIDVVAARIAEVLAGKDGLRGMGESAAAKASEFTLERNVEATLAVYREILAEKRACR